MGNKIKYNLIDDDKDTDNKRLKCIINDEKRVIFEFTHEVLRWNDCLNLGNNPSAEDLYKKIEKFLKRELDNNSLEDRYFVGTKNFSYFCL